MKKGGMRCLITILLGISLGFIFPIYVGLVSAYGNPPPPPPPDFSISVSPNQGSYPPYNSTTATITVGSISGYTTRVTLSASGQPSGVTSFNPTSGNPTFYSTMTINISGTAPFGVYTITITGTADDGKTHSTTYTLIVSDRWYSKGTVAIGNRGVLGNNHAYNPYVHSGHVSESSAVVYRESYLLEIGWAENKEWGDIQKYFVGYMLGDPEHSKVHYLSDISFTDHWLKIIYNESSENWVFTIDTNEVAQMHGIPFRYGSYVVAQSESTDPWNTFAGHHYYLHYYTVDSPSPVPEPWDGTIFEHNYPYTLNRINDGDFYTGGGFE